jgi:hypothetical protein
MHVLPRRGKKAMTKLIESVRREVPAGTGRGLDHVSSGENSDINR